MAQIPKKLLSELDTFNLTKQENLCYKKKIPNQIKTQALLALAYYPELLNVNIKFRFRKRLVPLTSRPGIGSLIFQKAIKRKYIITISTKSKKEFSPILYENLPFNAQVGVLGHELAHTVSFSKKCGKAMMHVALGQLSPKYLDKMEFQTDQLVIDHGMGWQLLSWSSYVRNLWKRVEREHENYELNERYMYPETIILKMKENKLYGE